MRDHRIGNGHNKKVNRNWRRQPAEVLADQIETIRRRAGAGEHLGQAEWHELDLMRRRLVRLQEAAQ
jgi:hypothetical protein